MSAALGATAACATPKVTSRAASDVERARVSPELADAATLAPQQLASAEGLRAAARQAEAQGDTVSADLLSERAIVAYERAVVLARLARATRDRETKRAAAATATLEAQRLTAGRADFEREAEATATELAASRASLAPSSVGPADASREAARRVAAGSLVAEADLLCGAARLLLATAKPEVASAEGPRLDAASRDAAGVRAGLDHPARGAATPVDGAAHARAACLDALTRTRRATASTTADEADGLLSALSARGGLDPTRDERGVVVTLRGAFRGTALTEDASRVLEELGRVAATHGPGPVQVVLHDATPPDARERDADEARAKAALAGLARGWAGTAGVNTATAAVGAQLPTADPSDARSRARNARLDVVFVTRSE